MYSKERSFGVGIADYSPVTSVTVDTHPVCEHNVSKDPNLTYDPARSLPITQAPGGSYEISEVVAFFVPCGRLSPDQPLRSTGQQPGEINQLRSDSRTAK